MMVIVDPDNRSSIRDRGEIKYRLGDYRGASSDLDAFIREPGGHAVDDDAKTMAKNCKTNLASLN
jgi:regulator of sirC expression with transglutaminase-like and TPR domain